MFPFNDLYRRWARWTRLGWRYLWCVGKRGNEDQRSYGLGSLIPGTGSEEGLRGQLVYRSVADSMSSYCLWDWASGHVPKSTSLGSSDLVNTRELMKQKSDSLGQCTLGSALVGEQRLMFIETLGSSSLVTVDIYLFRGFIGGPSRYLFVSFSSSGGYWRDSSVPS